PSLTKPALILLLTICGAVCGCARKGDPVPVKPAPPAAPSATWETPLRLKITLPSVDAAGGSLGGLEEVRVLYLPLGLSRPSPQDVFLRGEVILSRQRPSLPDPGEVLTLDLKSLRRPAGWLVVVAVRGGGIAGAPSPTLPWLDPVLSGGIS
ncbi:MAG TPA: hypothetical protein VFT46_07745, partial [Holophagaceae bacterium]|nr:hypothetical protein [Holophagaceae bacterium]